MTYDTYDHCYHRCYCQQPCPYRDNPSSYRWRQEFFCSEGRRVEVLEAELTTFKRRHANLRAFVQSIANRLLPDTEAAKEALKADERNET